MNRTDITNNTHIDVHKFPCQIENTMLKILE